MGKPSYPQSVLCAMPSTVTPPPERTGRTRTPCDEESARPEPNGVGRWPLRADRETILIFSKLFVGTCLASGVVVGRRRTSAQGELARARAWFSGQNVWQRDRDPSVRQPVGACCGSPVFPRGCRGRHRPADRSRSLSGPRARRKAAAAHRCVRLLWHASPAQGAVPWVWFRPEAGRWARGWSRPRGTGD